ncbi:uncharacterized protein BDR25DRAFT_117631 [Lindgomyces ingoldianus]|uniref:Uncharacterized protein n=1 Tax=Lindgomyces ingoldianus TaxID=673940 RepID=A0ACB6Q7S5_9PLEO|nr:uncharacterized protein BDR25DRAFT_117631 [Lindgomyces ingoldianus]KAF2462988.1 hypothetical protein BDR25DRAFT_117631 [Lindgomyces ingoldianus]
MQHNTGSGTGGGRTSIVGMPSGVYLSAASSFLNSHSNPPSTSISLNPPLSHSSPSNPDSNANPPEPPATTPLPGFIDHYAVLSLDIRATPEEIKSAYRALRATYFQSSATKYRALQAAFDVLADADARRAYDGLWKQVMGLPDLGSGSERGFGDGEIGVQMRGLDLGDGDEDAAETDAKMEAERKEQVKAYKPLIGTRPYHSYIPILEVYEGSNRHPVLSCWRPSYVLYRARNSKP